MTTAPAALRVTSWTFDDDDETEAFRRDQLDEVVDFLFEHLDQFGDPREHVRRCLLQASGRGPAEGGTVTLARKDGELVGAVVTNDTHLSGYTPENLLVYVATHGGHRGEGIGRAVMERAVAAVEGSVALHVEPDNPAFELYRKLGFTHKYLEMRLER